MRFLKEEAAQRASQENNGMSTEGRTLIVKRSEVRKKYVHVLVFARHSLLFIVKNYHDIL